MQLSEETGGGKFSLFLCAWERLLCVWRLSNSILKFLFANRTMVLSTENPSIYLDAAQHNSPSQAFYAHLAILCAY